MVRLADVAGFQLRVKFFDYGVLSLGLSQPLSRRTVT